MEKKQEIDNDYDEHDDGDYCYSGCVNCLYTSNNEFLICTNCGSSDVDTIDF